MSSKPRTIAEIPCRRRHADRACYLVQRDPADVRCYTDLAPLGLRGAVTDTPPGPIARLLARAGAVEPRSASSTCAP